MAMDVDFFTIFWYNLKDSQPFKGFVVMVDEDDSTDR